MVKRYSINANGLSVHPYQSTNGRWVEFSDLAPLLAVVEAAKEMRRVLATNRIPGASAEAFDAAISRMGKGDS